MSCSSTDTLELKAGYLNRLPLTLDDGASPINLTGATIRLVAKAADAEEALIDIEQTSHTSAAAGESSIDVDLTEVSAAILSAGVRLNAEIVVIDSTDVLVFDQFFTLQIRPQIGT